MADVSTTAKPVGISSNWLMRVGAVMRRYGLVVVLAWIGVGKYVKMESRVLIEHSPLFSSPSDRSGRGCPPWAARWRWCCSAER